MTLQDYLDHYLKWQDMLVFFLLAVGGCMACILIIFLVVKLITLGVPGNERAGVYNDKLFNTIQRFYDVVFSGASILSFLGLYYLIDRFLAIPEYRTFWDAHKDMLLLLMIVISILFNNLLDHVLIPLKKISNEERGSLRVAGMLYVIFIFLYIKYIYENDNYDGFIMYFLGLMIGRFVYFDASFKDFLNIMKNTIYQIPVMILGLMYTSLMCYFGFSTKYLLKSNGVLVSTFFAHVFMIVAIFLIHHTRFAYIFKAREKHSRKKER